MGLEIAAIGSLVVGTALQINEQRKAANAAERRQEISQNRQQSEAAKQRRRAARQARVRQAQVRNAAQITGTLGSSSQVTTGSAIETLRGSQEASLSGSELFASAISKQNQKIADAQFRQQVIGGVQNLAQSGISLAAKAQSNNTTPVSTATPTSDIGSIGQDLFN